MTLVPIRRRRADKVAVLHGAVSPDAGPDEQDTLVQTDAICQALAGLGFTPVAVPLDLDLARARARLVDLKPAFVFNLVESVAGQGRLIHLAPSLLESLGLPYTGAAAGAVWLTSQKTLAKRMMTEAGIATPPWTEGGMPDFTGPYIVKSVWEHASIGIDAESIVTDRRRVNGVMRRRQRQHGGEWFAERFIDGREFNLSLLGGIGGVEVLPPAEMLFVDYPEGKPRIVDYAAKWHAGSFEFVNTVRRFDFADTERPLLDHVAAVARACWRLFNLRGYARVDVRVDGTGTPQVLEVNVNPCLSPDAGFAAAAARAGLSFSAVVQRILADRNPAVPRPAAAPLSIPVPAASPGRG